MDDGPGSSARHRTLPQEPSRTPAQNAYELSIGVAMGRIHEGATTVGSRLPTLAEMKTNTTWRTLSWGSHQFARSNIPVRASLRSRHHAFDIHVRTDYSGMAFSTRVVSLAPVHPHSTNAVVGIVVS